MQLTRTIFPDSAIFIEKKTVENRYGQKSIFVAKRFQSSLIPRFRRSKRRGWRFVAWKSAWSRSWSFAVWLRNWPGRPTLNMSTHCHPVLRWASKTLISSSIINLKYLRAVLHFRACELEAKSYLSSWYHCLWRARSCNSSLRVESCLCAFARW